MQNMKRNEGLRTGKVNEAAPNEGARPLEGRTILVTRAETQAREFVAELERRGARVIHCPVIEIVPPESYDLLDEAIENLYGYDWLIFTSANGVRSFLQRLTALGHETSALEEVRICAIGKATAKSLIEHRLHVDLVPEKFTAEGVFAALEAYVGGRDRLRGLVFLIPRAAVARDYLPKALEEAGARVDVVPAYRTVRPQTTDRARIEALLIGGSVDCVTFTSSSTVANFAQLFDTNDLGPLLTGVAIACIGEITARTAAEYGLQTHIQPTEYTTAALAQAIADYFARQP